MDPKTAANATAWWNRFGSRYPQDWIAGKVIADSALAKDIV
jgi:hypothetical protein